ncbi:Elongation of very long chain fatty acids protein 4 [Acropora cervicornis]|uniref:Elongation of very long chain fatty acids protein n=1 Tax=Acropora cervicornis TaxID=6130 RepID=A0AAD9QQV5_ACRCE|nr:Elongation of very long chain fatty acids protein 4 [Acropora cervicornis]
MTTTQRIVDFYQWAMEKGDPKTADWPLVATTWPTIALVGMYLFVVKVGPKIMETRKAYNLREVLIVYNFALFIASVLDIPNFNYMCEPVHYVRGDPRLNRLARICYIYWLSKFVEYFGSFFFILRKKNNQLSFLHVYHHAGMSILFWMVSKYVAAYFAPAINSFVHVVMYAYYGLAAISPQMQPYLWWKAHITKLQLTQFVILLIYWVNVFGNNCMAGFPQREIFYLKWIFVASLLVLFSNFYIGSYLKPKHNASRNNTEKKFS